jgi:hypothetical protein
MPNPQKAKGTRWESEVVRYLRSVGFDEARREVQRGARDVGDIGGFPLWAIEAKAYASVSHSVLADFVAQANREARHAGKPFGIVVIKRPRHRTADGFVVMDLETWTRLERHLRDTDGDANAVERSARQVRRRRLRDRRLPGPMPGA